MCALPSLQGPNRGVYQISVNNLFHVRILLQALQGPTHEVALKLQPVLRIHLSQYAQQVDFDRECTP